MSQARITLRPPPNVEFVHGYPGIPGNGHERPHAEVRGTIELRLGAQGVKAKWVQVELRKVETLPGGGQANTFYDYVGTSPVKVWGTQDEWGWLQTQDFPFSIRIPESIPPSIALEKNAGIKYELVAKVCMKGKKGLFRKAVAPTLSTMTQIVIDKHELHSTWPVYAQPWSRSVAQDRLTMTVDRTHTCYGPGDRISLIATFRNDAISVVDLRAFEFVLKETIIFRAGPHAPGKKGAPQVRVITIGEQKAPVNQTVYGGQQHRVELSCIIPQSHTTTTVNAARHIDIAYMCNVKAVFAAGKPVIMEFPVTISNWPRSMSIEAVRRIGPSVGLSLLPQNNTTIAIQRPHDQLPVQVRPGSADGKYNTANGRVGAGGFSQQNIRPYSIAERVGSSLSTGQLPDSTTPAQGYNVSGTPGGRRPGYDEFGVPTQVDGQRQQPATYAGYGRAANSYGADGAGAANGRQRMMNGAPPNRLTLVNADLDHEPDSPQGDAPANPRKYMTAAEEKRQLQNAAGDGSSRPARPTTSESQTMSNATPSRMEPASEPKQSPRKTAWPTADEEKAKLYNQARSQAEQLQASMGHHQYAQKLREQGSTRNEDTSPSQVQTTEAPREPEPAPTPAPAPAPAPKKKQWLTAEEEKIKLFQHAQHLAAQTQALAATGYTSVTNPSSPYAGSSGANSYFTPSSEPKAAKSTGAALYSHALASMNRSDNEHHPQDQYNSGARPSSPQAQRSYRISDPPSPPASKSRFPTAEEEKAALRYYDAKRAVDRHQNLGNYTTRRDSIPAEQGSGSGSGDDLIAYDALYPAQPSGSHNRTPSLQNGFSTPSGSYGVGNTSPPSGPSDPSSIPGYQPMQSPASPPPAAGPSSSLIESAMAEKERLRRKYEAEDAAASTPAAAIMSPSPPAGLPPSYDRPLTAGRSQPLPPVSSSAPRQLTAAEEKARLKAQYEAEENAASGSGSGSGSGGAPAYYANSPPASPSASGQLQSGSSSDLRRSTSLSYAQDSASPLRRSMSYAADTSPGDSASNSFVAPPPPPPLAPKPPMHYIEETEQEDALSQAEDHAFTTVYTPAADPHLQLNGSSKVDFGLPFRPFSPFDVGMKFDAFNQSNRASPSQTPLQIPGPPPLPPKLPVFE